MKRLKREKATLLLVVEDSPGDARLLREMFEEHGERSHIMTLVGTWGMADKHLAEHAVDILLLDLGLPDAQGLEAVHRAQIAAPAVPLVVLSGSTTNDSRSKRCRTARRNI